MKRKSRVGIAFLAIFALAICGFVGFELFDTKINLNSADSVTNGKWCIKLKNVDTPSLTGDAKSSSVSLNGTTMKFNASFTSSKDSVAYDVQLVNCGTQEAYLYSVQMKGLENQKDVTYNVEGIDEKDVIEPDEVRNLTVNVLSNVSSETNLNLEFMLNFSQK